MKVGGNESATKFFQQNGGTAALNSKDPKTKYQSNAATKYKEELKKRAARDAQEYVGSTPHVFLPYVLTDRPLGILARLLLPTARSLTEAPPRLASLMTTSFLLGTSRPSRSPPRPSPELAPHLSLAAPRLPSSRLVTPTAPERISLALPHPCPGPTRPNPSLPLAV